MNTTATDLEHRDPAQDPNPPHPEWRSRVDRVPDDVTTMDDLYIPGNPVRIEGPRGFSKVYTIAQALGNGVYRLQDGVQMLSGTYLERNLRRERSSPRRS